MQNSLRLRELKQNRRLIWVCDDAPSLFQSGWFEQSLGVDSNSSVNAYKGRQGVQRFEVENQSFVLRHYYRGGVPAHFTKDRFFFRAWHASRSYREICLLLEMNQARLPVPIPVAAQCDVHGLFYSADIIMRELKSTSSLADILQDRTITSEEWSEIGATIKRFHLLGFQHVDLNARNILIDHEGNVYLIDFDRCVRRPYAKSWASSGLKRLKRSLVKIKHNHSTVHFHEDVDFDRLIAGYDK